MASLLRWRRVLLGSFAATAVVHNAALATNCSCSAEDLISCAESPQQPSDADDEYFIQICSVFGLSADLDESTSVDLEETLPCSNSFVVDQVDIMVDAINDLNDQRGFPVLLGRSEPVYFKLNYTVRTYPFGAWDSEGEALSYDMFSGEYCDLVVGMTHGCADAEIIAQAAIANAAKKIVFTARGPRAVMTMEGNQPYFFSTHLRSDNYAKLGLQELSSLGAKTASLIYEDYGNFFYTGLGVQTAWHAREYGFDVEEYVLEQTTDPNTGSDVTNVTDFAMLR